MKDVFKPAFPSTDNNGEKYAGMLLRDYFAAKAMQGLLSNPNVTLSYDNMAEASYLQADAMMMERETI